MKKTIFLVLSALLLLLLGCRTETLIDNETPVSQSPSNFQKTVKLKDAFPFKEFIEKNEINSGSVYSKGKEQFYSSLSDETEVLIIAKDPVVSYSTVVSYPDHSSDVLVYTEDNENRSFGFIAKHIPADPTKNYLIEDFTGTVEYRTMDGVLMGTKELLKGTPLPSKPKTNNTAKASCSYSLNLVEVNCHAGNHTPDQYSQCPLAADEKPYYVLEIIETCPKLGPAPLSLPELGLYGGGGGNGGDGNGGGAPVDMLPQDAFNLFLSKAGYPDLTPEQYAYVQNHQYVGSFLVGYLGVIFSDNNRQLVLWAIDYLRANNTFGVTDYQATKKLEGLMNFAQQFLGHNNITWVEFQNRFITGYSDKYKTQLSSLSLTELDELVAINTEMYTSPYEEEFVKEANEAFVAFTSYADIETMTDAQIEYVLNNNCCAGLFITQFSLERTKTVSLNYKALRKLYPDWDWYKCLWEASRETVHLLLDIGGAFPLIGEVCDLTNGAIYTMSGDQLNAALSFGSAIPLAGWGATVAKFATKTVHLANGAKTTLKFLRGTDAVVKFGNRGQLRKVLGLAKGDLRQAHHIIPWELYNRPAIQKAALSLNAFHLNEALNGIPLSNAVHAGSHGNYTNLIRQKLDAIPSNYTPNQVYDEVIKIINKVKTAIKNNPNTPINQLVF